MVFINEWLPNPNGADASGEFVELFNGGAAPVNLAGWILVADGKKKAKLSGILRAGGYLVLRRGETKLSIRNSSAALSLYDAAGDLVDQSAFDGTAPEGESFSRVLYPSNPPQGGDEKVQRFAWSTPTPGAKNSAVAASGISEIAYPTGIPLNAFRPGWLSATGLPFAMGIIFALVLWYAMGKDENISELFFGNNEDVRP